MLFWEITKLLTQKLPLRLYIFLQLLYHLVYLRQLAWYMDALRTVGLTLSTLYAVVGLTVAGHGTVQRYQVLAAVLTVFRVTYPNGQRAFVLAFIIMYEDGWNINTIRTRHAVLTIVAGDVFQTNNLLGNLLIKVAHLIIR